MDKKQRTKINEKCRTINKSDVIVYGSDFAKKELRIFVSEDRKTMLNENAMKTYKIVNKLRNFRTPEFIGYDAFRRLII